MGSMMDQWAKQTPLNTQPSGPQISSNPYWRDANQSAIMADTTTYTGYNPEGNGKVWDVGAQKEREIGWLEGLQSGYSWVAGPGSYAVGWDAQRPGGAARQVYYTPPAPTPAPAAAPQEPVIEATPAPEFNASDYAKPSSDTPQDGAVKAPGYQIDSSTNAYAKWLENPKSDGSGTDETSTNSGAGGDRNARVQFYQDKMNEKMPTAASASRYVGSGSGYSSSRSSGGQRFAGSALFKDRLNRYRS